MELVTIAIPTMKRLAFLRQAVTSALDQSYAAIEVLIGQDPIATELDASVREWCVSAAKTESRIRYQSNAQNLGLAGNWNALARAARGTFMAIIGDDDRLAPNFVERLMTARIGQCDVVFCNHHVLNAAGDRIPGEGEDFARRYGRATLTPGILQEPERSAWRGCVPMSGALLRTEVVRTLGFRDDLNTPEIEFFIRLAQAGGRFCYVPDYLAEYRVHPGSATAGGLRIDRLVRYLVAIRVARDMESEKAVALRALVPVAVSLYLKGGDTAGARHLLLSRYYPRSERFRLRGVAQALASFLPAALGKRFFARFQRARQPSAPDA